MISINGIVEDNGKSQQIIFEHHTALLDIFAEIIAEDILKKTNKIEEEA
jgi:hypothetical protein